MPATAAPTPVTNCAMSSARGHARVPYGGQLRVREPVDVGEAAGDCERHAADEQDLGIVPLGAERHRERDRDARDDCADCVGRRSDALQEVGGGRLPRAAELQRRECGDHEQRARPWPAATGAR